MDTESESSVTLHVPYPFGTEQVFRYDAMEDILKLLLRNPFRKFSISQLRDITNNGSKTTTRAVDLLDQLELIRVDTAGRTRTVRLNRTHATIPDEPLFALPQDEFRDPVRTFHKQARNKVPAYSALIVFGSVAQGTADRQSDIDIWLLITDHDNLLPARRTATEIAANLTETRFGTTNQRYEFDVLVESVTSALSHTNADDGIDDILANGIVIDDSNALSRVKDVILGNTAPSEVSTDEQ